MVDNLLSNQESGFTYNTINQLKNDTKYKAVATLKTSHGTNPLVEESTFIILNSTVNTNTASLDLTTTILLQMVMQQFHQTRLLTKL